MLSEYTVPWVASESAWGAELAEEWIESEEENIAAAGWATFPSLTTMKKDEELDLNKFNQLIDWVMKEIKGAPNRVKYCMNGFIIAVGGGIKELTVKAQQAAEKIGKVEVDMHGTECKVPPAGPYLQKMIDAGRVGKKRKTARC